MILALLLGVVIWITATFQSDPFASLPTCKSRWSASLPIL
jgi:hypothetical protein